MISCVRSSLIRPERTYERSLFPFIFFLILSLSLFPLFSSSSCYDGGALERERIDPGPAESSTRREGSFISSNTRKKEKKPEEEGEKKKEKRRRGRCLQTGWLASTESSIDSFIDPKTVARAKNTHTHSCFTITRHGRHPLLSLFLSPFTLTFSLPYDDDDDDAAKAS